MARAFRVPTSTTSLRLRVEIAWEEYLAVHTRLSEVSPRHEVATQLKEPRGFEWVCYPPLIGSGSAVFFLDNHSYLRMIPIYDGINESQFGRSDAPGCAVQGSR